MRIRALVAVALLAVTALPAAAGAQRLPMPRGRGPARPAPLPDMPASLAREYAYKRLPFSLESYPMISFFDAAGAPAGYAPSWSAGGLGTRVDVRVKPYMSATLDLTSSFLGGPSYTQTAELGTRFRPERTVELTRRWFPYFDVRVGYVSSLQNRMGTVITDPFTGTTPVGVGSRYSTGFGAAAGTGIEYAVTRMVSVVSGASAMQSRMQTRAFSGGERPVAYDLRSYRYVLALRFSPVRAIQMPNGMYHTPAPRP